MTTFDRYVLGRFLHVFFILFVTVFGLFVVIDGFTNVDGFQRRDEGTVAMFVKMVSHYGYQCSLFFDLVGSILSVLSVLIVFAILHRNSEVHPLLAAGVPSRRLLIPVLGGTLLVNLTMVANQELVIPRISHILQASRGEMKKGTLQIEPVFDNATQILIDGERLTLANRHMQNARFVLPDLKVSRELTRLDAQEAIYLPETSQHPAGWLLRHVQPRFDKINLTEEGKNWVKRTANDDELFVVTDVSYDQLYNRSRSYKLVSTPELMSRIRNPAFGIVSVRGQLLHLHFRIMKPFINLIIVLIAVPLMLRRESTGLVTNMAVCAVVLIVVLGVTELSLYFGKVNLFSPHMAAWAPVFVTGGLSAWLYGLMQT